MSKVQVLTLKPPPPTGHGPRPTVTGPVTNDTAPTMAAVVPDAEVAIPERTNSTSENYVNPQEVGRISQGSTRTQMAFKTDKRKDLGWRNISFAVGDKKILTGCSGSLTLNIL